MKQTFNMRLLKQCLFLGVIVALFASCKPGETTTTPTPPTPPETPKTSVEMPSKNDLSALIGDTWKLVGMTFYEKDQYIERPEDEKGLTVSFNEGGKFNYVLTMNKCMGQYSAEAETMEIQLGGCTKMCCDSKFAKEFQTLLSSAKSYKIHDDKYLDINCKEKILKLEKVSK